MPSQLLLSHEPGNVNLRPELGMRLYCRQLAVVAAAYVFALPAAPSLAQAQDVRRLTLVDADHVRIGSVDGPPETTFSGIVGAFLLNDDRLVVADGGNRVVRFFDLNGVHRHSIGREGSGPGEFRVVQWLGLCENGPLVAGDPLLGRLSVMTPTGDRVLQAEVLPSWVAFNAFVGCDEADRIYILLNEPTEVGPPDEVTRAPGVVARFRRGSEEREDVLTLGGTDWYFASRPAGFGRLPLGAQAHAALGGGYLFGAQSDAAEIHVVDLQSANASTFEHGLARQPATPALRAAALRSVLASYPLARTRALVDSVMARAPVPDQAPYFMDIIADRAGNVWLREPSAAPTALWHVYSADGRRVATVRMESNLQPTDIGERHVVALETDASGVQYVRLYRFAAAMLGGAG